jgi:hypothetical protein
MSSSEYSVKLDCNETSDKLSGMLKYISRLEGCNEKFVTIDFVIELIFIVINAEILNIKFIYVGRL